MSCTAKLPIYSFFTAAFFPDKAPLVMLLLYFGGIAVGILTALIDSRKEQFINSMDDDLNTADGIAAVFDLVSDINTKIINKEVSKNVCQKAADMFDELTGVLGLVYNRKSNDINDDIEKLIEERQQARANKDWATADRIRDELKAQGITLKDTPQGVTWIKE